MVIQLLEKIYENSSKPEKLKLMDQEAGLEPDISAGLLDYIIIAQ